MEIRRPWEPTDDVVVFVGEALETISSEQWTAMDFWMGYLAASAYRQGEPAAAGICLGLVGKLRDDLVKAALPEARKLAKVEFDPRKLVRMEDIPQPPPEGEELTAEELREAAARVARADVPAAAVLPKRTSRRRHGAS